MSTQYIGFAGTYTGGVTLNVDTNGHISGSWDSDRPPFEGKMNTETTGELVWN